ncbi:M4 family metallopeptidase [Heyndrickxia acidicola]|uniref:Neutral metalloproteinase n=1 Tax=Heyndrickxia acidicola TaxID=209389 RepID=A0ABU6MML9_9BACI|nr:M4 family metallopeptidase [Heyndrickxia acidicola]MED1205760.1 M4 family metallopeptidase [Heyndrickxia acidicola]
MKKKKKNQKKASKKTVIPAVLALSVAIGGVLPAVPSFADSTTAVASAQSKQDIVKAFLASQVTDKSARSLDSSTAPAGDQFKIISENTDSTTGTYHARTIEQYNGIPIYGSGQTVALDKNNNVYAFFGKTIKFQARSVIPTDPSISEDDAIDAAKKGVESQIGTVSRYDGIDSQLTLYPYKGKYYLTYLVKLSTSVPAPGYYFYFVDATNGNVVNSFNAIDNAAPATTPVTAKGLDVFGKMQTFTAAQDPTTKTDYLYGTSPTNGVQIHTYTAYHMPEVSFELLSGLFGITGWEINTNSPSNFFYDPAAISAYINTSKVNDYYQKVFSRKSLDNKGMTLNSTVHVGTQWNNAAWNGKEMLYGDGDGVTLGSLSGGLDVTGHEMTHGVISNTANLTYQDESGAINESLADIFGEFIQINNTGKADWQMGEDVYTPNIPGDGGLRSFSDPASLKVSTTYMPSGHYPDTYQDRYQGTLDNGGVHINSGINNKADYLICQGGTNNGITITGIGTSKAQQIYYRALTLYLTPSSGFHEMREAAIQAARDLYPDKNGAPSQETQTVMDAYTSVGVN